MTRKFKQTKASDDVTSSAVRVFHSGPSGVYTFSKRDGIDTYQAYNPSPDAQGNRVPFGSGSIGTPPLALMSGGKILVEGVLDPGNGAGFGSPFSNNIGEIPDLENYPESGIWKDSNAEAGVDTTGGDTDSDTGTGGESCSSDTANGISVSLTGKKANSDTEETWNASASKEFLFSDAPIHLTGVIKVGGADKVFGVAQPFNNPTFEFENMSVDVSSGSEFKVVEAEDGDFKFVGRYFGGSRKTVPTLKINYKDGCSTCYKDNKDDSDALIGCWPQVPEMSKTFPLFLVKPFDTIFNITGGGSSKSYSLSPASLEAGLTMPSPIKWRPRASHNDELYFEVIGHQGGLLTLEKAAPKIGELVEFREDGTQVPLGEGNGIVLLSLVESEWSHAGGFSTTPIRSNEFAPNNPEPFDPTEGELAKYNKTGLSHFIKYKVSSNFQKDPTAVGQLYQFQITFNPNSLAQIHPKWSAYFTVEVI